MSAPALLQLSTGALTLEQLELMLTAIPVELSLVDENDEIRYFSAQRERIFPRNALVIGRKVQRCHPPRSVPIVEEILRAFRCGERTSAELWTERRGRFVHVRYVALRDAAGAYRGCVEIAQDATGIRALGVAPHEIVWDGGRDEAR